MRGRRNAGLERNDFAHVTNAVTRYGAVSPG
jgi:hypothetical protein